MSVRRIRAAGIVLIPLLAAEIATAQVSKLEGRLDPAARAAVELAIDSARSSGLPTEPLLDKALEGVAKHAPGPRIVAAVRTLASGLATARASLGPGTSTPDLVAGAEALRAGVRRETLTRLRRSRPSQSVLTPLVVLSDLISRGVPADAAADAVLFLAGQGASDAEFGAVQQQVAHDIQAGAPPAAAAAVRARGRSSSGSAAGTGPAGQGPAASGPGAKPPHGPPGGAPGGARGGPPSERPPKETAEPRPPKGPPATRPPNDPPGQGRKP